MPPCKAEFARLREDVQKLGLAAKAAGQRKASREEMCRHISAYGAAELKWVKHTEANVTSCGIPAEVVSRLKQVHSNTEQTREKVCASGPVGPTSWQTPAGFGPAPWQAPAGYSID